MKTTNQATNCLFGCVQEDNFQSCPDNATISSSSMGRKCLPTVHTSVTHISVTVDLTMKAHSAVMVHNGHNEGSQSTVMVHNGHKEDSQSIVMVHNGHTEDSQSMP